MNERHLSEAILSHHQIEDYFYSSISLMHQHISEDVRAYVTGVEVYVLNFLLVTDNHSQVAENVQKGIRLLDENFDVPFAVYAVQPNHQTREVLQQAGFVPDADGITTAMQLDLMNWPINDVAAEYDIRCVEHELGNWAIPVESAFETGSLLSAQYLKCHQAAVEAGKSLQHYALYVDGQPACALTLSRLGNIVRFDDIGTVTDMQRKGYASALVNHVLKEVKQQGAIACYLDASRDGNGVYLRTGFQPLFEYQGFIRE
ncbi:GNAT family acetyltransferase [Xenorhabdus mauleonii]|uniref:Acetyltransferase (GNAT) domain-containing protein n=1 Tax=Xenorhabdus mauleonii TaxID=351675 RepID=A0A1I3RBJ9_9GAMM|nr:GNAT family N-acetyltransferase [Xenorhabdus mauleonii]PHM39835.1 GNAT family acetyltransferase [Xenorhabdus mauleonii]SFJ43963.1 Acetyltransferase (GNAT) domain-containing protein [Xenorhabdus mauleonii]